MRNYTIPFWVIFWAIGLSACQSQQQEQKSLQPEEGKWRGVLKLNQEQSLPFNFDIEASGEEGFKMALVNAEERLVMDEIIKEQDSLRIVMHIFDAELKVKLEEGEMKGRWIKHNYKGGEYDMPFEAKFNENYRFTKETEKPKADLSGIWAVNFLTENGEPEKAVGMFAQSNNSISGTFLTVTGDYRYLEGEIEGDQLWLSCFDGEHAFLFNATINDDQTLTDGNFWSGKHWHQQWEAKKDPEAMLPDASSLTFLKEGYDKIEFEFLNLSKELVSLNDERYKGKVVIVQLLGTWCPNCMDETAFLAPFYKKHKEEGLEVIGLAFERSAEFDEAAKRVQKMKERMGVAYEVLIAGTNDKEEAAKKLPMLNQVLAFPTTIFIDRKGEVRKIHTGFSGPGTGKYYQQLTEDMKLFVDKLLREEI
ncbi:TlpA disulfide reductase family protein [Rapidithrix thailandica]|uniref:TlpA disulfide reductase family protein n=1 Tax=Rapidithrix thailandica TaxID=413964 RepID=A0AAW9SFK3_9BACT